MPLAVQVVKRSIARKTRRGCLENPSPEATLWTPDKRPDESGRGSLENPFASIELDGRPTSAEMSLGAAGRSACATSRPEEPAGFHEFRWAGGAHGYRHECPRHIVRRAGDFGEAAGATVAGPSIVDYKADDVHTNVAIPIVYKGSTVRVTASGSLRKLGRAKRRPTTALRSGCYCAQPSRPSREDGSRMDQGLERVVIAYLDTHVAIWLHAGVVERLSKEARNSSR